MKKNEERISLLILFAFAFTLRLLLITQKNLWFDEIYSWHITLGSYRNIIIETAGDIHPPLYYFALKLWEQLLGSSVGMLRTLSAFFSASTIFFIYYTAKRVVTLQNSFLIIFLFAISPLSIYFAQEARMASLNLLLNAGSIYFLILLINKAESIKRFYLNISFYLYTLFTLLALYTHYFSFFILASQIIFLIYYFRKEVRKLLYFIPSYGLIAWGYSPWFYTMSQQIKKGQSWRGGQNGYAVLYQFVTFIKDIGMGFYHRYVSDFITYPIGIFIFSIIILAIIGLVKLYKQRLELNKTWLLIILVSAVPFITAIIISFKQWIEYFRYLSIIVPFILLCIVIGIQYFKKRLQYFIIVILVLINVFGLFLYYNNRSKNNDYRQILRDLGGETEMIDIFVYPHYYGWILDYYGGDNLPSSSYYGWEFSMLNDTIAVRKPEKFKLIMDYHSMDSLNYGEYLKPILNSYDQKLSLTYNIEPNTVKVYYFEKKK